MSRLFIVGHPGLYGGASTELRSQIHLWAKAFPEIELHIIPTSPGYESEALYQEMLSLGVKYHEALDFTSILPSDAVINFCSREFLENVHVIHHYSRRIMWANCMTWVFPKEEELARKNYIKFYLYQRPQVRDNHKIKLSSLGSMGEFIHFIPYFYNGGIKFREGKDQVKVHIGRISRQDADKFSKDTNLIYDLIYAQPKLKEGHYLGWGANSLAKIGKPQDWIKTYPDQNSFAVHDFYERMDMIVQSTDTFENLPRIGFEAMAAGVPLVVDNRGGWQYMIEHGVNGFLCNDVPDFVYWSSKLARDIDLRIKRCGQHL